MLRIHLQVGNNQVHLKTICSYWTTTEIDIKTNFLRLARNATCPNDQFSHEERFGNSHALS